jgi:hypothetical protein
MASTAEPNLGINYNWLLGETEWKTGMDLNLLKLGALVMPTVLNSNLLTPPGSPTDGDMHIINGVGTGLWAGQDYDIAHWDGVNSLWLFYTPKEGWAIKDVSNDSYMFFESGVWVKEYGKTSSTGLTADVGSIQGGTPLTTFINEISTCANAGDAVTLPTAQDGLEVVIVNNGVAACDVFPASGGILNGGTVDSAESLGAGSSIRYVAYDATNWVSL